MENYYFIKKEKREAQTLRQNFQKGRGEPK